MTYNVLTAWDVKPLDRHPPSSVVVVDNELRRLEGRWLQMATEWQHSFEVQRWRKQQSTPATPHFTHGHMERRNYVTINQCSTC